MIYAIKRLSDGKIKIGWTNNHFAARKATLKTKHGAIELLGSREGDREDERKCHARFEGYRIPRSTANQPPNYPAGVTDWFEPADIIFEWISRGMPI